jgi:uncharacterized protein YjbJ (UPF0337 family)
MSVPLIHSRAGLGAKTMMATGYVILGRILRMEKDRVIGSAKVAKGKVKEAAGKALGDAKLQAEGKADRIEGKVQNAVGSVKDALRRD